MSMSRFDDAFAACFCTVLAMLLDSSSRAALVPPEAPAVIEALPQPQPADADPDTFHLRLSSEVCLLDCSAVSVDSKSCWLSVVNESSMLEACVAVSSVFL